MRHLILSILIVLSFASLYAGEARKQIIAQMLEKADSLHGAGRSDSAAITGAEAIRLAEAEKDASMIVGAHASQGVYLRSLGRIDEALESYDAALRIATSEEFRENPDDEAVEQTASLYINLAVLNLDMQNKDEAAGNALQSAEWVARSTDPGLKSVIYGAAGSVLTGCGRLQEAMDLQKKAYENALAAENADAAFRAAAYTMMISDRLGDKAEAQAQRERCAELMPAINSMMTRLLYYQAECSICMRNDDNKGAIKWFGKILDLDGIDNLPFVKYDCYNNLHTVQAAAGDYEGAYSTLLESNALRDSLWQQEKEESLRELTVKYETKETQLALAQSETRRARTLMWLFGTAGLLLLCAVLFVVYASRQRRRRMQKEIEFAQLRAETSRQYVEGLENERRRMSRELHDGVCNDLLAISMNIAQGSPKERTSQLIESCRESVRRISHELMPPEFSYATLDEVVKYYVLKQSEASKGSTELSYESTAAEGRWTDVPDAVALETYRIIQEATGNAVKHSGAKEIHVSLELDGRKLHASVRDNGQFKSTGGKGLGLDSIRRRANSVNGNVVFESPAEGGTAVSLTVKF